MGQVIRMDSNEAPVRELIELLHQGAPADEFARRLADVDAWPVASPGRSEMVETVRMAMAVRNRLELQQERERGLLAVIESAQDLSSRLDLQGLLSAIVSRARNLLGSDLAWLSTYEADPDEFHVLVVDGALKQSTSAMVARRDRGVAGLVMSTRLPFTTPDYLADTRFAHDSRLDDAFREEGIAALVGVPLIWNGDVIGFLFVADRYHRMHTAQSISILCTLATHGAVALKNARDFEGVSAALARADESRAELERHLRNIQAAADAHEQIMSLLARGASLATLCQSMAELLRGSVLVLDEAAVMVSKGSASGYASDAMNRYAPHAEHSADLMRAMRVSRESGRSVVAFEAAGETCRVMAVIGGDDILGSALLFHRDGLEEVAIRTFERSASVIGVVLLSQQRMEATRNRNASALLRSLVSPRQDDPALLANRAEQHGIDLARPVSLVLVEMDGARAGYAARRFGSLTPLAQALTDDIDGVLVVLCAASRAADVRQTVATWIEQELRCGHRGVVSRPVSAPAEIPALYATLRRALGVLGRMGVHGQILGQDELAIYSTLFETHDRASLANFLDASIGPLLTHDRKRGSELAATLLAYFDCNQNAKTTGQRLGIHVNTVRQRLASIEDLVGHWGQASRALELHIALRLWSLSGPA
ncbi:helix-turn-helix domain-containing protein [Piscinibacter koreensis]|uniref:Helix-turn-helix domain-containing protein n=1 Tax=Piscinibacter koreensis TaxID=2742824 RepID=A0A7Y6NL94_9BURK|nr:helix-turn-helix domain-containing protein [Schlegelella koreensis]NUZ05290.1 helix-turn-helix domain-containing protein [Schlegelella koreensis]